MAKDRLVEDTTYEERLLSAREYHAVAQDSRRRADEAIGNLLPVGDPVWFKTGNMKDPAPGIVRGRPWDGVLPVENMNTGNLRRIYLCDLWPPEGQELDGEEAEGDETDDASGED